MWKEVVVASFKVLSRHLPGRVRKSLKISVSIAVFQTEILFRDLSNTKNSNTTRPRLFPFRSHLPGVGFIMDESEQ
jgi:hypothetical protein